MTEAAASEVRTLRDAGRPDPPGGQGDGQIRKQLKQAKAAAKAERGDVASYHAQMESLIDQYTALRNDTGAFTEQMRDQQMYMYEIEEYFATAATDRRRSATGWPPCDLPRNCARCIPGSCR